MDSMAEATCVAMVGSRASRTFMAMDCLSTD